jgi:hypothetical protein
MFERGQQREYIEYRSNIVRGKRKKVKKENDKWKNTNALPAPMCTTRPKETRITGLNRALPLRTCRRIGFAPCAVLLRIHLNRKFKIVHPKGWPILIHTFYWQRIILYCK